MKYTHSCEQTPTFDNYFNRYLHIQTSIMSNLRKNCGPWTQANEKGMQLCINPWTHLNGEYYLPLFTEKSEPTISVNEKGDLQEGAFTDDPTQITTNSLRERRRRFSGEQSFKWGTISQRGATGEVLANKSYNLVDGIVIFRHHIDIVVIYFPKFHLFFVAGVYMYNLRSTPALMLLTKIRMRCKDIE